MKPKHAPTDLVVVHHAKTATEAVVIRGLLQSVGIESPTPTPHDPFPMREPPKGFRDCDILARADQENEARQVIADHIQPSAED